MTRSGITRDENGNIVHERSGEVLATWTEINPLTGSGYYEEPKDDSFYGKCAVCGEDVWFCRKCFCWHHSDITLDKKHKPKKYIQSNAKKSMENEKQ